MSKSLVQIGMDDIDSPDGRCTTHFACIVVERLREWNVDWLDYPNLIRLNPNIPWKTRGNGAAALTFRIFDDPSAAAGASCGDPASRCVWGERQTSVQATGGTFSVLLGSVNPLDGSLFSGPDRWLEVEVDGEVMEPRQRIASAAYAMKCGDCGAATAGCPPDTSPAGAWCIDTFQRPVLNFLDAMAACHNDGRSIC